jgi:hypothetical protein
MWRPRAPHLAHTPLGPNDGTSTSSGNFDNVDQALVPARIVIADR